MTITEVSEQLAEQSKKNIIKNAERLARKKFGKDEKLKATYVQETSSRIRTTANYEDSVKNADLVIEAIIENLEAKHKLFALLDKVIKISFVKLPANNKKCFVLRSHLHILFSRQTPLPY